MNSGGAASDVGQLGAGLEVGGGRFANTGIHLGGYDRGDDLWFEMGGEEGWVFALAGFSFPFVLFPLGGVFFLVSWLWRRKRAAARL